MTSDLLAGAHEHEGRRILGGPAMAPLPHHKHAWAAGAPGPDGPHKCHEKHDDPLRANLLFIVSADQVRGQTCHQACCQLAPNVPGLCCTSCTV